jgi:predicted TPR repeat methyltransferase
MYVTERLMTCCGLCDGIDDQFDRKTAQRELLRFRRRGPIPTTKRLIDALRSAGVSGATVLDIGGGIGAIHHTLLEAGASTAMQVDASFEYVQAAREETARNGHANRVLFLRGDFVQWAASVPDADIVTLDRVICCYPDMESLVRNAAAKSLRLLGAVYPRDAWWVRFGVRAINATRRMRGSKFRAYAHSPSAIDAVLGSQGLHRVSAQHTLVWDIAVFARRNA